MNLMLFIKATPIWETGGLIYRYQGKTNVLGFDLYMVDINGLLDRDKIYGYDDDSERFIAFQIAVLTG